MKSNRGILHRVQDDNILSEPQGSIFRAVGAWDGVPPESMKSNRGSLIAAATEGCSPDLGVYDDFQDSSSAALRMTARHRSRRQPRRGHAACGDITLRGGVISPARWARSSSLVWRRNQARSTRRSAACADSDAAGARCDSAQRRGAAIPHGAGNRRVLADRSAEAEVVGIGQLAFVLDLLPSMPMSAIQCWPQLLGQPVTCRRNCWSNWASRSSSLQRASARIPWSQ